jgi:hypothetical protein
VPRLTIGQLTQDWQHELIKLRNRHAHPPTTVATRTSCVVQQEGASNNSSTTHSADGGHRGRKPTAVTATLTATSADVHGIRQLGAELTLECRARQLACARIFYAPVSLTTASLSHLARPADVERITVGGSR